MQLRLLNEWGDCPPGPAYYRYVFPEDGYECTAMTYVDWIDNARRHLLANERPIPDDLADRMQNQLCQTLPPGWCMFDDPSRPRPSVNLTFNDVAAGVKTFSRWVAGGCKYVPKAEAERRAEICSRCYLNVNVSGCAGCQSIIQDVIGDKHTKLDPVLRSCAVCKCFLKAKVHFPISTLDTDKVTVQGMYPDFCWLNKKSENYVE